MEVMIFIGGLFTMMVVSLAFQYSIHKNKRVRIPIRK
jgi:hypothetical protein